MGIYIFMAVLVIAILFSSVRAYAKKSAAEELSRSNARVLREFKRMTTTRPHFIVDAGLRRDHE